MLSGNHLPQRRFFSLVVDGGGLLFENRPVGGDVLWFGRRTTGALLRKHLD